MPRGERSEEAWLWYTVVYEAIQEIPYGKVTSYGHIARLVGKPERPRQVGVCLKHLAAPSTDRTKKSATYNSSNVPWQRVINARGGIPPRGPHGASRHAAVLRAEGVEVSEGSMGELTVDLSKYGWFPEMLPSETGQVESSDGEDEEAAEDEAAYHA
ncbi:hypothetical protein P154DRAFT_517364 [Amniculicola lignicola CBS 123094]|uniref:Methylated-DNA-[protein]-cysteine S-methyltransferase DNA binding domain-containing protein n=1 Tax=Amniculicola lignicola CBS 123094 TaxID=1392246 RepID=A0A6A5X092_9PLEO|nr:hypothetical protein P154DRAFT_517364 [Amniculicola lignicola CBS 123094]